ncbi:MAG: translation initiation factor IF-2 [Clostridia bacterium]|nr:translation initiation factor IF-2 [Clostridia bacterium]
MMILPNTVWRQIMAEKKELQNTNIKKLIENLNNEELKTVLNNIKGDFSTAKNIKARLEEKIKLFIAPKEEVKVEVKPEVVTEEKPKKTKKKVEDAPKEEVKVEPVKVEEQPESKEKVQPKEEKEKEVQPVLEVKQEEVKPETVTEVKTEPVTEVKTEGKEEKLPSFIVRRGEPEKAKKPPVKEYKAPNAQGRREYVNKDAKEDRPRKDFNKTDKKPFDKPKAFTAPPAPVFTSKDNNKNNYQNKKKSSQDKGYEDKKAINKRALIKNNVSIDDFDEDKSGYRKLRVKKNKQKEETTTQIKIEKAVITTEIIPLKVLSEKIGISAIEITKRLFKEGIMKTINDSIDFDTAGFIAADLGIELELKLEKTAEDKLSEALGISTPEDESKLVKRPPVVTVMGHVDHGKTSLLDRIRKTNVTSSEAGGITQHIGAYQVSVGGRPITFLDTPGHEAFTAMRARGAQATDIAVLVVAADDGIMPQTIEAINHAKAAGVSIIVAVNKIDKPEANIDRIKTQLTEHDLLIEEWGGDIMLCPVSAKTGKGVDDLLESINLLADLKELKANPDRKAKGVVIEAKLDPNRGPVATILIQNGTLKVTDSIVVGMVTGKVRAMSDDKGRRINSAGPSVLVSIMGLDEVPNAGDILYAVEQEKLTKLVAEERKNKEKEERQKQMSKVTLDDLFSKISDGNMKILNIVVKADVKGSCEAVKASLEKLTNEEVKVNVIHAGVGAINESDIMLADSSNAIVIGFNVRPDTNAKQVAERSGVDVKLYRVIYEALEDVEKAMKGMLAPKYQEIYMGKAEVRNTFKITGVGMVAGCYVVDGKIIRNGKLRIYRDDVMICEGNVLQLKRFKDDVKEVQQGFECGISIENFNDIKLDDFIECYLIEEVKQ